MVFFFLLKGNAKRLINILSYHGLDIVNMLHTHKSSNIRGSYIILFLFHMLRSLLIGHKQQLYFMFEKQHVYSLQSSDVAVPLQVHNEPYNTNGR